MKEAVRQTRSELMRRFSRHGFNPRTDLGQNFLIDINLVEYIVRQAAIGSRDVVLEVGAGTGGLTGFLAQSAASVISIEIDSKMHGLAVESIAGFDNVTLLNRDILKNKNQIAPEILDLIQEKLAEEPGRRLKLVANLPYNVATPVISNLVATDLPLERAVVTIQLELGFRMTARPKGPHYGSLSVWLQSQCHVEILRQLPPNVFWPRPQVQSAIVRLFPEEKRRAAILDRPFFHDFVRRLFHQRRKYLRSVLVGMYRKQVSKDQVDALLSSMELKEGIRAEQMSIPSLVELANRVFGLIQTENESTT